jgi:3-methylcrotonyl-CoA carboxylase beta subunit
VVTGIGTVAGREVVVIANDATVKAGSWWPETITKMLRAQEIAMRCRVPIIYLVDSAGVNLPYQGGVFPGQYGASRIFYYNSDHAALPQGAADRRGDGALHRRRRLPPGALRRDPDGRGHLVHGARRAQPGEGRDGQTVDRDARRRLHAQRDLRRRALPRADDRACVARIRDLVRELAHAPAGRGLGGPAPPARPERDLYSTDLPEDHRQPYEMREVLRCILDGGELDEFQADTRRR